ncbi:MAG: hypothetical protein ABR586_07580 [Thermoplasmatota archaeon]
MLAVAVGAGGTVGLTALLDHKPPPTGLNQGPVGVSPDDIVQGVQHFSGTLAAATSQVSVPCEDVGVCEAHPFAVQGDRNVSFTANLKARLPGVPGNGAAAPTFQVVIRTSGNHATIVSTQKTGTVATVNATLSNGTYEVFIQLLDGGPVDYTLDGILDPAHIIHTVVPQILAQVDLGAALGPFYLVAGIVGTILAVLLLVVLVVAVVLLVRLVP